MFRVGKERHKNLCISILEFKCVYKVIPKYIISCIYVFLYQNLNRFIILFYNIYCFIYVFLYQNLNKTRDVFSRDKWSIYVFLYQNLNLQCLQLHHKLGIIYVFLYQNLNIFEMSHTQDKVYNLCISILEFKLVHNTINFFCSS